MSRFWHEFIPKSFSCLKSKYALGNFRKDLISGMTVGILALPLAMAIAIASGVGPERGLFTGIVAGFLISFLGGSRLQIGGPTAAFITIVYGIVQRHGYEGLVIATIMGGLILLLLALFRIGSFIKYIPFPLVTGFTTGIAVILFSSQMKDFFGLSIESVPVHFVAKWQVYFHAFPTVNIFSFCIGSGSLALIILSRRFFPAIPWAISSISIITVICAVFHIPVETIYDRFGHISGSLPSLNFPGSIWSLETIQKLMPDAIAIALLAGLESLISAVIADGMSGDRHKSNCELMAQGFANIGSALFGGIPATAALARTAVNIKSGAYSPMSGIIHAGVLLLILVLLGPLVEHIPLPALSAVLIMVAWNMSELHHFKRLFNAPTGDIAVLLLSFLLTLFVDLTVAVEVGFILACFLFMKKMSKESKVVSWIQGANEEASEKLDFDSTARKDLPEGIEVYEINGPFFFGMTDRLKDLLPNIEKLPSVFILHLRDVPLLDASGLHALQQFYHYCKRHQILLMVSGVRKDIFKIFQKYGLEELIGSNQIFSNLEEGLQKARTIVVQKPEQRLVAEKTL